MINLGFGIELIYQRTNYIGLLEYIKEKYELNNLRLELDVEKKQNFTYRNFQHNYGTA